MDKKLIPFPKPPKAPQLHYKGLLRLFTRPELRRELEPVRDDEAPLHPSVHHMGMQWYTSRYSGPGDLYQEIGLFRLRDLGIRPELLMYRALRALYGTPDIITVAFPPEVVAGERDLKDGEHPLPWEWSFMLKGASEAYIEVRRQPGTQEPHLAVWAPKVRKAASPLGGSIKADLEQFLAELTKTMEKSQHLVDAKSVHSKSAAMGPSNVYADLIAAGDEHLEAASLLSDRYEQALLKAPSGGVVPSLGTFYLGAAISYVLALEGFVNLLSEILRKDGFRADVFERATTRADFELRLLTLPLYCNGFSKTPLSPDAPAFKNVRRLRDFRNNLLHANLSPEDHVIRVVPEDFFVFYWWPAVDEVKPQQAFERLPLARVLFRKKHAESVRLAVEATVDIIIESLAPEYKNWVIGWRTAQLVPAILKDDFWVPSLKSVGLTPGGVSDR